MHFHFDHYILHIYYDDVKLENCHILAVDDLHISTGMHATTLSCAALDSQGKWHNQIFFFFFFLN